MSTKEWNKIERIRRAGYLLLIANLLLGYLLYLRHEPASAGPVPDNKDTKHIHARRGVKLRSAPSKDAPTLLSIGDGSSVTLSDTTAQNGGWYKISYDGQEGYVWNGYLE